MPTDCITYRDSGYFSSLVVDYLNEKPELQSLYNHFPKIENFKAQIEEKKNNFNDNDKRRILVNFGWKLFILPPFFVLCLTSGLEIIIAILQSYVFVSLILIYVTESEQIH